MKFIRHLSIIIIGIVLVLDAFLLPFQFLAFDEGYYYDLFKSLNVHQVIGIDETSLEEVTHALVAYIDNGSGDVTLQVPVNGVNTQFYNDKEIIHLSDIQKLVSLGRQFLIGMNLLMLIGFFILWWQNKENNRAFFQMILKPFKLSFFLTIFTLAGLYALYFVDFDWAFTKFHEIFFTNDLWLLDPRTDRLIMLMPIEFFTTFVVKWLTNVGIVLAGYCFLGFFAARRLENR